MVFEFEDGKEPPVGAGMDFHGGRIVSAAFYDYRDDFFIESERDGLIEAIEEHEAHNHLPEEVSESIKKKVEMLTF